MGYHTSPQHTRSPILTRTVEMSWTKNDRLHCDCCGRFMSFSNPENDEYTNFGNCGDTEPPDPVDMCPACSKDDELDMIKRGCIRNHWVPSKADRRAAKVLEFAQAGLKGAAWSCWFKKSEPLPEGYAWCKDA